MGDGDHGEGFLGNALKLESQEKIDFAAGERENSDARIVLSFDLRSVHLEHLADSTPVASEEALRREEGKEETPKQHQKNPSQRSEVHGSQKQGC